MSFVLEKGRSNLWLGRFTSLEKTNLVQAAMTARFGGTSKMPYDSLNLAMHVGDRDEDVLKNRAVLAEELALPLERICTAEQVHGEAIFRVRAEDAGRGVYAYADAIRATDALMTDEVELPLMMCFADCVPIMLLDVRNRAVAIAHGGWKGTIKHIAEKTLKRMGEEFGTIPQECLAAIGPSIGPCCFQVGDEVRTEFEKSFPNYKGKIIFSHNGETHVDLWQANRLQLLAAGMKAENIDCAEVCTSCNSQLFYSYRAADGVTGRLAAIIALKRGELSA